MAMTLARARRCIAIEARQKQRLSATTPSAPGVLLEFELRVPSLPGFRVRVRSVNEAGTVVRVQVYHPALRPKEWYRGQRVVNEIFGEGRVHPAS